MIIEAQKVQTIDVVIDPIQVIHKLRDTYTLYKGGWSNLNEYQRGEYDLFNKLIDVIEDNELVDCL